MFLLTLVGGPGERCGHATRMGVRGLIECWTLDEEELALLSNKSGATRLGFGLMLKFFELEARFPRREDVPRPAVEFMAGQVKVDAAFSPPTTGPGARSSTTARRSGSSTTSASRRSAIRTELRSWVLPSRTCWTSSCSPG
ncbi:DUF4158 domain-containing protein [Nonomuraea jabiensis]|uniref:DUF4158 domain-containing protein n=1 Tax=Nonomuraea jabiensis TaxID=882448 RepID=UPI00343F3756